MERYEAGWWRGAERSVFNQLEHLHTAWSVVVAKACGELGPSERDLRVMQFVTDEGTTSVTTVARWLGTSRQNARVIIEQLRRRGWVAVEPRYGQREHDVTATTETSAVLQVYGAVVQWHEARVEETLGTKRFKLLRELLTELDGALHERLHARPQEFED